MSWNLTAGLNPEFVRGVRTGLPRRRAVFVVALTAAILAAGGWLIWNNADPGAVRYPHYGEPGFLSAAERRALQLRDFGRQSFGVLTVALFGLMFVLAPATAGLSFVQERLRGTAVFQQMTLLSPARLAAGKFFGSGLLAYLVAAMLVPCALFAAALGHVHTEAVVPLYLFLFVGGLCWQAIGLGVSAALAAPGERALRGGLLTGPLAGLGGGVTALALVQHFLVNFEEGPYAHAKVEEYHTWSFFGANVPSYVVILLLLAFVGVWAFVGAVRGVKAWQLIPVRPHAVWLFIASAELLVVGLLWGRQAGDTEPATRLVFYMLINWAVLAALAGAAALGRGRLREWWSVERDPLSVFHREGVKNALKTFLLALGVSLTGLAALWWSYHVNPDGTRGPSDPAMLAGVAFCFALTMLGMAAFVQYVAMHRFRIGGWAGVVLMAVFYVFTGVAGMMFHERDNAALLANPVAYAEVVTKGDYFMDSDFRRERYEWVAGRYVTSTIHDPVYERNGLPGYDVNSALAKGVLTEGVLALSFFGLAYAKWARTRAEMLEEAAPVV